MHFVGTAAPCRSEFMKNHVHGGMIAGHVATAVN
jgi:hypothetical protein